MVFRYTDGVIRRQVGDEIVVYDPISHESHLLTALTAKIFENCHCRTLEEIHDRLPPGIERSDVERQLFGLAEIGLLQIVNTDPALLRIRRRDFIENAGKAAAALAVSSVLVPTPVAAQSACAGVTTFVLRNFVIGSPPNGALTQTDTANICIQAGATAVNLVSIAGGNNVDEIVQITTSGPGSVAGIIQVSSFAPLGTCPARVAGFTTALPRNITALFAIPATGIITPTVRLDFCNGSGPRTFPGTQVVVTY